MASAATSATFWRLPFEYARPFFVGIEVEPLEQVVAALRVQAAAQRPEQVDRLAAGEVRPQADVTGHVREAAVQVDGVAPRIAAQHGRRSGVGAQQPEQHPDRRGLAGAVRAEEAVHLARPHRQVEPVERARRAERLDEALHSNCIGHDLRL